MSYAEPLLAPLTQFSWEEETTYKTRPTNINRYIRLTGEPTLPIPERNTEVSHAPGHGRGPAYVLDEGRIEMAGSFEFEVVVGQFLGAVFGICVTTGSDPYTHTFNLSNAMPKSFAIQHAELKTGANLVKEWLGCRVNTATLKVAEDSEKLVCAIDYLAAKAQDGGTTPETVTTNRNRPFLFKEGAFSSTSIYSGPKARVHNFELPININAKSNYAGGQGSEPYDILPGKADFGEMTLTVGIEDDTEWDEIIGAPGTRHDFSYLFDRGTNDTFEISGYGKLKTPKWKVEDHDVRADLIIIPDEITVEVIDTVASWAFE